MNRVFASSIAVFLLSACANTHKVTRHDDEQHLRLSPSDGIYISVPQDGAYGSEIYRGSGLTTTQIAMSSFQRMARIVRSADAVQSFEQNIEGAKTANATYLVYLAILHWEDRNTEWSGKRDQVEVKVEIVDVASGKTVTSASVKGRGKWMTLGGLHPQDLLQAPFDEFVVGLY